MSEHSVRIIEIAEVRPHTNAERLEIVPVGGWQAVVAKGSFKPGDRGIYIEPDYTVPLDAEPFKFLDKGKGAARHRLKAVRLRGTLSYGLLIPVPAAMADRPVGTDVMGDLAIERYVPPAKAMTLQASDALPEDEWPKLWAPKFDIENLQKWHDVLQPGEPVWVTEKLDGGNARFVWHNDQLYIGSRTQWLKNAGEHMWKRALDATPAIVEWCKAHPHVILFGEVYGWVQSLRYGAEPREVRFAAFAALDHGKWLSVPELYENLTKAGVPVAAMVYSGGYEADLIKAMAEADSLHGPEGHMREGLVIVPAVERHHPEIGRVAFKLISNRFWLSDQ